MSRIPLLGHWAEFVIFLSRPSDLIFIFTLSFLLLLMACKIRLVWLPTAAGRWWTWLINMDFTTRKNLNLLRVDLYRRITKVLFRHYYAWLRGKFMLLFNCFFFVLIISISAGNEHNYRTTAYEAITSFLTHATPDAITVVQSTAVTILQRVEHLLSIQVGCINCLSLIKTF